MRTGQTFGCLLVVLLLTRPATAGPFLGTPGEPFDRLDHIVSTSVFHWFSSSGGQLSGPWRPVEGRSQWTGTSDFWKGQIKQMMMAGVDVINVHLIPHMDQQRVSLFKALGKLRAEGYDVPKVVPFLDPIITWNDQPKLDMATAAGKQTFVNEYIRFYDEYFSVNTDAQAESYLARIDGRVVLDTWHVSTNLTNIGSFTRQDLQQRLATALAASHPVFNSDVYMVTTAGSKTFSFADERVAQFQTLEYFDSQTLGGLTAVQLKPGYWDQNIRNPGSFRPRDGGLRYKEAWARVDRNTVQRVYLESWNEYDEGTGIYAGDPGEPYVAPGSGNTNTDTWSTTDDPFEYIKTAAAGARAFNDTPDRDAKILWHNFPKHLLPRQRMSVQVVVRNEGDLSWTEAGQRFRFGQKEYLPGEVLFGAGRFLINDWAEEIPLYGGIFRGRPITFAFDLVAPKKAGSYTTHWSMVQELVTWFGEELAWTFAVAEPGDANLDGRVDDLDASILAAHWQATGVGWTEGDFDGDGQVSDQDAAILAARWQAGVRTTAVVPEPAAWVLLAGIGLAISLLRGHWTTQSVF